ncbi:MAG: nuclear transport factor 2 family protein [Actinobacteria bacterium]|nr:nuclear transport factor 2 family protein [Actinomycetota bacterium]
MKNVDALRVAIEAQDRQRYTALLAEDVRFFSPIEAEASVGREPASMVLSTVFEEVFEDFRYVEQLDGEDLHLLVFQARVRDVPLEGVDLLKSDGEGLVREFTVMIRPLETIQAIGQEMSRRMGDLEHP